MRKIICFPFAGAGASIYAPWVKHLDPTITIVPVQLPGHEQLFMDPPLTNVDDVISHLRSNLSTLTNEITNSSELLIFGHSLGAILAYAFARTLSLDIPSLLIVSGSPAPTNPRTQRSVHLSDHDFLSQVRALSGYDHPALQDEELRELLLPALRADVQMHEEYSPKPPFPVGIPIISVRGSEDALVSKQDAMIWREFTTLSFRYIEVEGDHMYLINKNSSLFEIFQRDLNTHGFS
ncbi:thioesterase II family protein [Rhizobium rhizogenes]|uniref:thioesterase II family protein n=1 Tax=Rhizobium rhizogenes TaxID=359 RepID=UPI001295F505|nr:alpha/beta fold hydrolase [Rhizobium rhizogenes]MQB34202.1 thioesterase [Rhizobium rhizogenes]